MSTYQKPVATLIDTTAEGVYMASGDTASSGGVTASFSKKNEQNWGESGQTDFDVTLKGKLGKPIKLTVTFDKEITNAWGGGANCEISSPKAIFNIHSPSEKFEISVQGKTGLSVKDSSVEVIS
ncbi:hypothetical protein D7V86_12895 [bacterium D16-51]|nr:hypothetical protein D7V96_06040 [bacterium D16-59]RKI59399.1 hypothetical protein D7V86_12895 [bacterium D16-51]